MSLATPVLLITWRRSDALKKVIAGIRSAKPSRLYVACDGPRSSYPEDMAQVAATREVIEQEINWPCRIERLYSEENQGCGLGIARAINWFFEHVEEGIVLEDDCVPHPDFFAFSSDLLHRYRDDLRVWNICGHNPAGSNPRAKPSYSFRSLPFCWGWATWKSRWAFFDYKITTWPIFRSSKLLESVFPASCDYRFWRDMWQWVYDNDQSSVWDYQWFYACISNGGFSAIPSVNLVSNIGFDNFATHTTLRREPLALGEGLDSLEHPKFIIPDKQADRITMRDYYGVTFKKRLRWRLESLSEPFRREFP